MSHRKFEKPRSGNLGFLPRKRVTRSRGKIKSFPKDDSSAKCHLTGFIGYKVGTTHTMRDLDRIGSKRHQKEICEQVTFIETPKMVVVGVVGYKDTLNGPKVYKKVFANKLGAAFKRRCVKNWYRSKRKVYSKKLLPKNKEKNEKENAEALKGMETLCTSIRVIAHSQPSKIPALKKKTGDVVELQVNGGSIADKVAYAKSLLEQEISVSDVFKKNELIDVIGVTKGHGFQGVIKRWGVTKLPRKTHKGLRKVACIGSWHPSRVSYTVARAGQHGYHHRTQYNKKIFMVGDEVAKKEGKWLGTTAHDLTKKTVNPLGGFPHYGYIRNEFLMIKGGCVGCTKRVLTLRKTQFVITTRVAKEKVKLKFIDTASKIGKGRFQTAKEKRSFLGPLKLELENKRKKDLKRLQEERKRKAKEAKEGKVKAEEKKKGKKKKKSKKKRKTGGKKKKPTKKKTTAKKPTKKETTTKKETKK